MAKQIKIGSIISPKVVTVKADVLVSKALEVMEAKSVSSVIIVDEDVKPTGIFTEHDALRCIASEKVDSTSVRDVMSEGVLSVHLDENIHDAYAMMSARGYRHIVVVDDEGVLAGLATQGDFLRHIGLEQFVKLKLTKDVMNKSLVMIDVTFTLEAAAKIIS